MEMHNKINLFTASVALGVVLVPAQAATDAADSPTPAVIHLKAIEPAAVMVERAESLMARKDFSGAERVLEEALRAHPEDADVTGEMGMLRLRQDKHAEAYEYFTRALKMTKGKSDKWRSLSKVARFWQLLREARDARRARDFASAERKLNEAIRMDPKVADSYAILGGVQDDRGQTGAATDAYRKALSINPLNNEALEGLVAIYRRQGMTQAQRFIAQLSPAQQNVLSKTISSMEAAMVEAQVNDQDEFLSALARIPAEKRPAHISRVWGNNLEKLVDAHLKSGRKNEAMSLLQEAETIAANDEEASLAVAASWGRLGDDRQADRMFDKLRTAHTPPSVRWRLRHAGYLAMKNSPELRAELNTIAAMPSLSSDEKGELNALQEAFALRTANAQLDSGSPGLAHQTLGPLLKASPDRVPLLLVEGRAFQAEKQWSSAQATFTHVLELDPGNGEAMRGQIESKMASGDRTAALAQLDQWAAGGVSDNPYDGLKMADLYFALGEPVRAHKVFDTLLQQYPNQPIALYEAAQTAHREGRLDDEVVFPEEVGRSRPRRTRNGSSAGYSSRAKRTRIVPADRF